MTDTSTDRRRGGLMKIRHRVAAVAAAAALGAGLLGLVTAGPAEARRQIVLESQRTNLQVPNEMPNVIPAPRQIGDRWYLREDLKQDGRLVGFNTVDCVVVFNENLMCTVVTALHGRGDMVSQGLIRGGARVGGNSVFDLAITGGTFEFRDARGAIHIKLSSITQGRVEVNLS